MKRIDICIDVHDLKHRISPDLYGIFFEDINFSCDGGINANVINNYSFDGIYYDEENQAAKEDPLRYWKIENGNIESCSEKALHANSKFARIQVVGNTILYNQGYNGLQIHKKENAISIKRGHEYSFSCYIRSDFYSGTITVGVKQKDKYLTDHVEITGGTDGWHQVTAELMGMADGYGEFAVECDGSGILDIDCIQFMDADYWNRNDPKWKYSKLRKDIAEAIKELKPAFMRFPGGCIVEGLFPGNEYRWKNTIGELYERKSQYSLWGQKVPDGGYNQSYQIGFYEYLCLCEDLKMKPLPVLNAGMTCQYFAHFRGEKESLIPLNSKRFTEEVIGDFLDFLEFAEGDPATGKWAAIRSKMGHPEPFHIEYIGVGNENFGEEYHERFMKIREAVRKKRPDMKFVYSAGPLPEATDEFPENGAKGVWRKVGKYKDIIIDEHSYQTPQWFAQQTERFSDFPRDGAGVYYGEYAANGVLGNAARPFDQCNQWDTALGEAAFLTGLERNGDFVRMSSYAPLLNLVGSNQWGHNLIDFNPQTVCLTANYYVLKMFAEHVGDYFLETKGEFPENIFVSSTTDGKTVFIKLVNRSKECYNIYIWSPDIKETDAIVMRHDSLRMKNSLDYFEKMPQYSIKPEMKRIRNCRDYVTFKVESYSVNVLTLKR